MDAVHSTPRPPPSPPVPWVRANLSLVCIRWTQAPSATTIATYAPAYTQRFTLCTPVLHRFVDCASCIRSASSLVLSSPSTLQTALCSTLCAYPLHEYAGPTPPYPRRARARGLGPRPAQLPTVHAPGPARQDVAGRPVGARVGWVLRAATVGESSQPAQRRVHALLAALREAARHQYDPRRRRHAKRREGTVLVGDGVVSVGRCRRA